MPGVPELLVILLIVLLIFGAGKLPAIGDALGRSIKNFKRSASGDGELEVSEKKQKAAIASDKHAELKEADVEEADVLSGRAHEAQPASKEA